jgi:hypothetical protein
MGDIWVPINPPVLQIDQQTVQKDSHAFPGTHLKLLVNQTQAKYAKWSTDGPLGLQVPPYPVLPPQFQERDVPPRANISADIHMTPPAVVSMQDNEQEFADLMHEVTGEPAATFFALGHAIYTYGLANAKNPDGSLDAHVTPLGATAKGNPILISPHDCAMLLQLL